MIIVKMHSVKIDNYADYYIEALERVLQNYNSTYITWCLIKKTIRDYISDKTEQVYKMCGVILEIRIN